MNRLFTYPYFKKTTFSRFLSKKDQKSLVPDIDIFFITFNLLIDKILSVPHKNFIV